MITPLEALEKLVRCESPTEDLQACRAVITLASEIANEVLGTPGEINDVLGRPVFTWGAKNPEIVLLAHLDTVWPHGSFTPLWSVDGDVIRGPGVFDMKTGFVQALFAMQNVSGSVALIATTDEETGSEKQKQS